MDKLNNYERPYRVFEIKKKYPILYKKFINDKVHMFRAVSGIELIYEEPTLKEQKEYIIIL